MFPLYGMDVSGLAFFDCFLNRANELRSRETGGLKLLNIDVKTCAKFAGEVNIPYAFILIDVSISNVDGLRVGDVSRFETIDEFVNPGFWNAGFAAVLSRPDFISGAFA